MYGIWMTMNYLPGTFHAPKDHFMQDGESMGSICRFPTKQEAEQAVKEWQNRWTKESPYQLSHGEYSKPELSVKKLKWQDASVEGFTVEVTNESGTGRYKIIGVHGLASQRQVKYVRADGSTGIAGVGRYGSAKILLANAKVTA